MIYIAIGIIIITILAVFSGKKTSQFKNGYSFAENIFQENCFRNAIKFLEEKLEESRTFHQFDDFDKGLQRCMHDSVGKQICKLNDYEGGDWYFDYEDYTFKDSLTSRQIIL